VLQELLRTLQYTSLFFTGQLLRGEVIDAVGETTLNQVGIETHEVLHLLLLNESLELLLLLWVQLVHLGVRYCDLIACIGFLLIQKFEFS
jgi:hypothetical protein